jgi:hypothetical protein
MFTSFDKKKLWDLGTLFLITKSQDIKPRRIRNLVQ